MLSSSKSHLGFLALAALLSQAQSQVSFPQCIRDCIDSSPDTTCQTSDIACLCRSSQSSFLVDIVFCMHHNCISMDPSILLGPLQFACQIAGATIPQSVIDEAESAARSLDTAAPMTTATNDATRVSSVSVEITTTVQGQGNTQTLIYPVTIEKTRTVSGEPATVTQPGSSEAQTVTQTGSGNTQIVFIPVVLTTTNSVGSTITTTVSQPGAVSTLITTDSRGSTITQRTTLISTTTASPSSATGGSGAGAGSSDQSSAGSSAVDAEGTTTILESTTVAGVAFTSTDGAGAAETSATKNNNKPPTQSDSAPFTNTNAGSELRVGNVWSWGVLVFLGAVGMAWL